MKKYMLALLGFIAFNATCFSQTIDSMISESKSGGVWQKNSLDVFTRDANCFITSVHTFAWDEGTQSWINSQLSNYTYQNNGDNSETIGQTWDGVNGVWVNNSKSIFFVSDQGTKRTYIYQNWDAGSGTWINGYKLWENMDAQGRTVTSEFDLYSDGQWQRIQRGLPSYNDAGFVASSIFQVWSNNAWQNNGKTTYDYTGNGKTIDYLWSIGESRWILFRRTYNDYIENTALSTKSLGQTLSGSEWSNFFRSNASYDNSNKVLSNAQQFWDANIQGWVNSSRTKMDYYSDGSQRYFQFDSWDATSGSWSYSYRVSNTDVSCTQSLQLVPVSTINNRVALLPKNGNGNNLIQRVPGMHPASRNSYLRNFNALASNGNRLVYDLSLNASGRPYEWEMIFSAAPKTGAIINSRADDAVIQGNKTFVISPNPAKSYFNVNLSGWKNTGNIILRLSDVSGKTILQHKMEATMQRIDLPSIQKGIYIVTIKSGKEIKTQKLVVE